MVATYAEALDQMHSQLRDPWILDPISMNIPILYWDTRTKEPANVDANDNAPSFVRIVVQHATGAQVTLANESGNRRDRAEGIITIQIKTPLGDGQFLSRQLVPIVQAAYRKKSTTGDVIFRNVRLNEIGRNDIHFQTNVVVDFEYDELI